MTKYLLLPMLLLLSFFFCDIGTPNGATASYPKARRKYVSHMFGSEDCTEEECLESGLPQRKELE
jgi:hypothetical protein